jgi:hypothetical protein
MVCYTDLGLAAVIARNSVRPERVLGRAGHPGAMSRVLGPADVHKRRAQGDVVHDGFDAALVGHVGDEGKILLAWTRLGRRRRRDDRLSIDVDERHAATLSARACAMASSMH